MSDLIDALRSVERFWFDHLQQGGVEIERQALYGEYLRFVRESGEQRVASRRSVHRMLDLLSKEAP